MLPGSPRRRRMPAARAEQASGFPRCRHVPRASRSFFGSRRSIPIAITWKALSRIRIVPQMWWCLRTCPMCRRPARTWLCTMTRSRDSIDMWAASKLAAHKVDRSSSPPRRSIGARFRAPAAGSRRARRRRRSPLARGSASRPRTCRRCRSRSRARSSRR